MEYKFKWYQYRDCFVCSGTGTIEVQMHLKDQLGQIEVCPCCNGKREIYILMDLDDKGDQL